jgi:cellobiose phosphorylase
MFSTFGQQSATPATPLELPTTPSSVLKPDQLAQRARALAAEHTVALHPGDLRHFKHALDRNERLIHAAHRSLLDDTPNQRLVMPAAEWLLDNIHIVVEQIREIRRDLPGGYYAELPKLTTGSLRGLPRVYAIAQELIVHSDSRLDLAGIIQFVLDYQAVTPLTMGELWAIAIMLRFGLVENLARIAGLMLAIRAVSAAADAWADRLLTDEVTTERQLSPLLADLARTQPEMYAFFAVRLFQRLRNHDGERDVGALITWLEQQPSNLQIEALIHTAHTRQAAHQAAIGNTITSMRTLNMIDWADWFECVSLVEYTLRQDPAGAYQQSTLTTRDHYRHQIEQLSRQSSTSEMSIARRVIDLARAAQQRGEQQAQHIGYSLIGPGRSTLEAELGYRPTTFQAMQRLIQRYPTTFYLGSLVTGTATLARLAARATAVTSHAWMNALLFTLPASAVAKELTDRLVATLLPPRTLPRLDLRNGIPAELRTIVVVPTLLLTPASVRGQVEALEVLALANDDPHLHFALLSDWADAPAAEMPNDAELLNIAREGIVQLNQRYGADRFLLLHRQRVWNEHQGCFMGWERKRGKLEEFNQLLAGASDTTFCECIGEQSLLTEVRYVITLDADTQLPRDVGRALIGTLAHPLNHAVIDPQTRRVVAGYGILQPRVGIALPSALQSHFSRIFSGNIGLDPYTTAVSDTYMDLLGEGIYAGKGIYDPHALRETLTNRFPDNRLLSHDLIEGNYARVGLLSDVELLDNYPATYAAFVARQHRWVRGDWQIAAWLLPWTPTAHGVARNVLPLIARFKIFDNLRRSLLPAAIIALLGVGWLARRSQPTALRSTLLALAPLALPLALDVLGAVLAVAHGPERRLVLQERLEQLRLGAVRLGLNVAFLPDQAITNLDAIIRTLARLLIFRRNLLEWETAAAAQARLNHSQHSLQTRMLPFLGTGAVALAARSRQVAATWPSMAPVAAHWLAAPTLAGWLDQPLQAPSRPLTADQQHLLRKLARRTWAYFEQFVTEEGNYLAPDNFQETPSPLIAFRTSPTNIGLQLLADLAAFDFGYIGMHELTERTEQVFATMERLEKAHGHWLNWYDTRTLQPLPPAYLSTVDSGNLVGALLALRHGYLEMAQRPLIGPQIVAGLEDALALAYEHPRSSEATTQRVLGALSEHLAEPPNMPEEYLGFLNTVATQAETISDNPWLQRMAAQARSWLRDLAANELQRAALFERQHDLANLALEWFLAMDFAFLYDDRRRLFVIGYSLAEGRRDNSFYDLLASEARLASFLAIGKGDIPQEHWFRLGRTRLDSGVGPVLASWSGTMFEYLMPLLLMHTYPNTLLDISYHAAVARQIQYGQEQQIPWGVSESAFNTRDPAMNYQYRAFGVPGLGLKRGLSGDLVVAPYATVLALLVRPQSAIDNLQTLIDTGMIGQYGLYEAIDYTADRLPPGAKYAIVRSYMVHHQGMSLLAFGNMLYDNAMQRRFHAEPLVQATEMLLQERAIPTATLLQPAEVAKTSPPLVSLAPAIRHVTTPTTAVPYTHLLSNGNYTVMLTNAGGGYSSCNGTAITRWRSDPARDHWGSFCYIRDVRSDLAWAATYQPTRHETHEYRAIFGLDKVEFQQHVAGIESRFEIVVSPEENVEVRRLSLINLTSAPRELEVTSYAEIVLASAAADAAHPAFSNLFVETEFVAAQETLLASRRPRSANATRNYALHVSAVQGHANSVTEYETDRAAFIGRGRTTANPRALHTPLNQQVGAVLDPIFSLRRRVRIPPGGTAQIIFTTGIADTREAALQLADRYRDSSAATRALSLAWTASQIELRHLNVSPTDAQRFQRFTTPILYLDEQKRARAEILLQNQRGQSGLWAFGISGDEPIVLVRIAENADLSLVQEVLQAHQYWRLKNLKVDLVLVNEGPSGYLQPAHDQILNIVRSMGLSARLNQRGGVFVVRSDIMSSESGLLLQSVARCVLSTTRGGLAQHLRRRDGEAVVGSRARRSAATAENTALPAIKLSYRTTYGGFTADRAFIVNLQPGLVTPAPWANVIANPRFGFLISEQGAGYTWASNSRENRLTPWSNDPVSDPVGEVLYLRDDASGAIWSATPQPASQGHVRVRHGFGITSFEQQRHNVYSELRLAVPREDPVKWYRLRLKNTGDTARSLSLTLYVEWVLGVFRDGMAPFVITERDEECGALLARNPYSPEFANHVAFLACSAAESSVSADRVAFIGRNGDLANPAGLLANELNGRVGTGFDPCGAIQCRIVLEPGAEHEVVFLLGQGADLAETQALIERYRRPGEAVAAEQAVSNWWDELLGQIQVATPDPAFDLLLNGWLLYQTLACRVWARSALYQSGGAYGFRDQLQDVMALLHCAPEVAREQILRAATRQFVEGDVQHWWHPPTGRGVRTRFSDDYLWLPFVTEHYLRTTGDLAILNESLAFLEGRALADGEAEYYDLPSISAQHGTLYEHCVRVIELALTRMGPHGLPLIGAGDWNDGMNMVGHAGRGESIWVGWFLHINLVNMAQIATQRGDTGRALRYQREAERLLAAIEAHGWDGAWYRRAYYDDGTPLGSASSDECQIDSIAQSWAIIGGAADPERATQAMHAATEQLVDRELGLIKLFTPPFNHTPHDPGYIKGYVPGVRENGGQYTHAALWLIWAWALQGDGQRAGELFELINPICQSHANPERYMVEPYVIAADVYAVPPNTGRGGWTWYTGSAGWMYRLGIEMILGVRRAGNRLTIAPCIRPDWPNYEVRYRYGSTHYQIQVYNPHGVSSGVSQIMVDGVLIEGTAIELHDDGGEHLVEVTLGT